MRVLVNNRRQEKRVIAVNWRLMGVYRVLCICFVGAVIASCAPAPPPIATDAIQSTQALLPFKTETPQPAGTSAVTPAPFALPSAASATQSPAAVSFYRLRVELNTTSDWTSLDLASPQNVLTTRTMNVTGNPAQSTSTPAELSLSQPIVQAVTGGSVGMTVDYAFDAAALRGELQFILKRGSIPATTLTISAVTPGGVQLIRQIKHAARVPTDPATNALPFSIDPAALSKIAPTTITLPRPDVPRMVWAFYYPWYQSLDWNSRELPDHPTPTYRSNDPAAISRQIDQAKGAGIDGFIASWWGPESIEDRNLKAVLPIALQKNFKIAFYFETLDHNRARPPAQIYDWLAYLISTYRDDPAVMKVDGEPVIALYNSGLVPLATWRDLLDRLHAQGDDATYISMGYDVSSLDLFNGMHNYAVFNVNNLAQTEAAIGQATRYYPLLADPPAPKIWAATVQPGYDDRRIPGRAGQVQERKGGAFYRSTFEAALASQPDWIFITTWNEWWENTSIEPGQLYGDQYLQITREYAARWKGAANGGTATP